MKKGLYIKVKLLPPSEYRKLTRILKLRLGYDLSRCRAILYALEHGCKGIDPQFSYEVREFTLTLLGAYDPDTHTVLLSPDTYDRAYQGDEDALYTIVHEISHWALLTVFHVRPEFVLLEFPAAFASTTDAELYADMFSCYMIMPHSVITGGRKGLRLFAKGKTGGIYRMPLIILKNRRHCRAFGHLKPNDLHGVKKTA